MKKITQFLLYTTIASVFAGPIILESLVNSANNYLTHIGKSKQNLYITNDTMFPSLQKVGAYHLYSIENLTKRYPDSYKIVSSLYKHASQEYIIVVEGNRSLFLDLYGYHDVLGTKQLDYYSTIEQGDNGLQILKIKKSLS